MTWAAWTAWAVLVALNVLLWRVFVVGARGLTRRLEALEAENRAAARIVREVLPP